MSDFSTEGAHPSFASGGQILPALRQDLRLHEGPRHDALRVWLIHDPVRHRYFQISASAFELVRRWAAEPIDVFVARVAAELGRLVVAQEVKELSVFLIANNLTISPPRDDAKALASQYAASRFSPAGRIISSYLFFKTPLVKPERFLRATMFLVAPLFSRAALVLVTLIALAGVYLASRQWDQFVSTFQEFLTFEGWLTFAIALLVVKALHELGHAYSAARLGVRVPTLGVAFMVLTPVLYTDVSDAWLLRNRRDKLAIDAAGIIVELALAGIALFLWAFLSDGPLRSMAFVMATTSLALGLFINLNPLMRFDGYYLLSDMWGMPNLQARSNALAIWWLRENLFALGRPAPESFRPVQRFLLIGYAVAAWLYRQVLFLGIALVVYFMFFKALGLALFLVEVIWFIGLPIWRELKEWWAMRGEIVRSGRAAMTFLIVVMGLLLILVPWNTTVAVQGVALAEHETRLYPPRPGKIVASMLSDGRSVAAGERLLVLSAPDLDHDIALTKRRIELSSYRLNRIAGDAFDRSERVVIASELTRHRVHLEALIKEQSLLVVTAPHDGTLRDVDPDLKAGEWIDNLMVFGRVVRAGAAQVKGYVAEDDLWRVDLGAAVVFVPEDPQQARRRGRVTEVVRTGIRTVELAYLASAFGGSVASDRGPDNEIRPRSGWHLIRVALDGPPVERAVRGTLHVDGRAESFAATIWRRVLQVLVRESSA